MIYAITYKDFRGTRKMMFDNGRALIFEGSELTNKHFEQISERLADLLDGSPIVHKKMFSSKVTRTEYPQEKIALWRQMLQSLEVVPYKVELK